MQGHKLAFHALKIAWIRLGLEDVAERLANEELAEVIREAQSRYPHLNGTALAAQVARLARQRAGGVQ